MPTPPRDRFFRGKSSFCTSSVIFPILSARRFTFFERDVFIYFLFCFTTYLVLLDNFCNSVDSRTNGFLSTVPYTYLMYSRLRRPNVRNMWLSRLLGV